MCEENTDFLSVQFDQRKELNYEQSLAEKCPELAPFIENGIQSTYMVIKGHVQSGKTNFMICASALFVSMGYAVVHLLRDRVSDREQIHERLVHFQQTHNREFKKTMNVVLNTTVKANASAKVDANAIDANAKTEFVSQPNIYLALSNKSSMIYIASMLKRCSFPYILFIDEVDFVDSGTSAKKNELINDMKRNAHCVFGVSATVMDPLGKEPIKASDIILIGMSPTYKGIKDLTLVTIPKKCRYSANTKLDLFEQDSGLEAYIDAFLMRPASSFPRIGLVNICRTKEPCQQAQLRLGETHPTLATIVYNGDGISFRKGKTHYIMKSTISSFLQYLKENGGVATYPHLLIFAGDLAGRCISFVSTDYEWHLSEQRLLVSSCCDEPELMQKIRLCGIYKDDVPLTLYTTKKTMDELYKAYLRQEEFICSLRQSDASSMAKTVIEATEINHAKMSRRRMVKDKDIDYHLTRVNYEVGWNASAYELVLRDDGVTAPKYLPPAVFYEAYGEVPVEAASSAAAADHDPDTISKLFKKWSTADTKIARFMQELDPDKVYTNEEMADYVESKELTGNFTNLFIKNTRKSNGYGNLLEYCRGGIRLRSCLVELFKAFF